MRRPLHRGEVKTSRFIGHSAVFWANFTREFANQWVLKKSSVMLEYWMKLFFFLWVWTKIFFIYKELFYVHAYSKNKYLILAEHWL